MDNPRVFEFKRGEKYSCHVIINEDGHVMFKNIIYPVNTSDEIKEKFLEDAEKYAFKLYEKT